MSHTSFHTPASKKKSLFKFFEKLIKRDEQDDNDHDPWQHDVNEQPWPASAQDHTHSDTADDTHNQSHDMKSSVKDTNEESIFVPPPHINFEDPMPKSTKDESIIQLKSKNLQENVEPEINAPKDTSDGSNSTHETEHDDVATDDLSSDILLQSLLDAADTTEPDEPYKDETHETPLKDHHPKTWTMPSSFVDPTHKKTATDDTKKTLRTRKKQEESTHKKNVDLTHVTDHASSHHTQASSFQKKEEDDKPIHEPVHHVLHSTQHLQQMDQGHEDFAKVHNLFPHLGRSLILKEGTFPKGSRLSVFIVALMLVGFLVWATITPIHEVAVAQGSVIPTSFVKTVQHLEGGIIKKIFVKEGETVSKGDVLIELDGAAAQSELEQIKAREAGLRIRAERLRAFGSEEQPNFSQFDAKYKDLIQDQQAIFNIQQKNREDQQSIIQKQIEQRKAALIMQEGRVQDLDNRVNVLKEQRDILKGLYEKRLKTGTEYRGAEDLLGEVLVDLNQAKNSFLETQQSIAEAESRMLELNTRLRNEALNEMGNVTTEIAQLYESRQKLEDRVKRLRIDAPTDGIVKGLQSTTLQGVLQPGAEIMQIVPKDALEVEARVLTKDIGKLKVGQDVLVKVSAFDYARYGGVKGKVKSISATTFLDEKNNPYYRVFVTLNQTYVGHDTQSNQLAPGMTVQADIITDSKTLLQYLTKPIYIAIQESFRER